MLGYSHPVLPGAPLARPQDFAIPGGLWLHYPMTRPYTIEGSTLIDATQGFGSGVVNHATLQGSTKPSIVDGRIGREGALKFSSSNGGIDLGSSATLIQTGNPAFGIVCWIYAFNFTDHLVPFYWGTDNTNQRILFFVDKADSKLKFDPFGTTQTFTTAVPTNVWTHIAMTHRPSDLSQSVIWVNGSGQTFTGITLSLTAGTQHHINASASSNFSDCLMYDWRYYNRELTSGDVIQLYYNGIQNLGLGGNSAYGQADSAMMDVAAPGVVFRKTLSRIGTRTGSRQVHRI